MINKVLVIAQADSPHTSRTLQNLITYSGKLSIDLYPSSIFKPNPLLAQMGINVLDNKTNYEKFSSAGIYWEQLYNNPKPVCTPSTECLAELLRREKYDVVHIMCMQQGGYLYLEALDLCGERFKRPFTVLSLWGNCVYYFSRHSTHKEWVRRVLTVCDRIHPESQRDVAILASLGYAGEITEVIQPTFVWEQLCRNLEQIVLTKNRPHQRDRRIIAVRGSYEVRGRGFLAISALKELRTVISKKYRVIVFGANATDTAEFSVDKPDCFANVYPILSWTDVQRLLTHAKLVISLNTTDGTPQLFYEATANYTYGIFSTDTGLSQFNEGESSFPNVKLVRPNHIEEIKAAILEALTLDDESLVAAIHRNWEKISKLQSEERLSRFMKELYQ